MVCTYKSTKEKEVVYLFLKQIRKESSMERVIKKHKNRKLNAGT